MQGKLLITEGRMSFSHIRWDAYKATVRGFFLHITGVLRKTAEGHGKDAQEDMQKAEARFMKDPTNSSYRA